MLDRKTVEEWRARALDLGGDRMEELCDDWLAMADKLEAQDRMLADMEETVKQYEALEAKIERIEALANHSYETENDADQKVTIRRIADGEA